VGDPVVAIPGSLSKGRRVTEIAIDQVHSIVGHKAARKTRDYLMDPLNCHAPNVTTGFVTLYKVPHLGILISTRRIQARVSQDGISFVCNVGY
jgi:hypothetical protein